MDVMKDVQVKIHVLDAVLHIPMYSKFIKELINKKRNVEEHEVVRFTKECSAVIQKSLAC